MGLPIKCNVVGKERYDRFLLRRDIQVLKMGRLSFLEVNDYEWK